MKLSWRRQKHLLAPVSHEVARESGAPIQGTGPRRAARIASHAPRTEPTLSHLRRQNLNMPLARYDDRH